MSAEKEIVNFWCNKRGFFTVNNLKTSSNRDAGILALKFDKDKIEEVSHIDVSCSITNNISETTNLDKSISRIVHEKFEDKNVIDTINDYTKQLTIQKQKTKKIIVLGAMPRSRKSEILTKFTQMEVKAIEFENVLYEVIEQLDTQYYKNDIIRTLQLTKFLLLNEPAKLAKMLSSTLTSSSRKEFLSNILNENEILKEFKKTNTERLAIILKNSGLKPVELAEMLENSILNKKTRKLFLSSFMEQEKARNTINKSKKLRKSNLSLDKFL